MNSSEAFAGKRVLITGGLGFIGSNLAIRLVEAGAKVTIVDSSVAGCGANPFNVAPIASEVDVVDHDIGDTGAFESRLREAQTVFNLAGEISHSRSMEDPERDLRLNALPQLRFLQVCRTHCPTARIIYAGTRQVYGKPEYSPVDEEHAINPVDFNGVHKYAATQYHLLLARRGDLDCAVLRLSNVYGPRMALHLPQQGFLGVYLQRVLQSECLDLYGDGSALRDPLHVDDTVDAFLRTGAASSLRFRVFNVGGPEPLTLRRIAEIVASEGRGSVVRQQPFPEHLRKIDIGSYVSDTARIRGELGWNPKVGFREGIHGSLGYYRKHYAEYLDLVDRVAKPTAAIAMVSATT